MTMIDKEKPDLSINKNNKSKKFIELDKPKDKEDIINDYNMLDNACVYLIYLKKNGFNCAINAPKTMKLGDGTIEDATKICEAHEIKILQEQEITKAKKTKETVTSNKIPICTAGGRTFKYMTLMSCPKLGGENRPILKKDKSIKRNYLACEECNNGMPCENLKLVEENDPSVYRDRNR